MVTPAHAPAEELASWFDAEDAPGKRDIDTCIHCGLCLTACPTYRDLKIEPDSPRGRIYLMRGLAEGRIAPSDPLVHHLDLCLDDRACETVCPAGVPYGRMLEAARGQLRRRQPRLSLGRRIGEWALVHLMPHRERLHLAADAMRLGQRPPLAGALERASANGWLPDVARRGLALTPPIAPRRERGLEAVAAALPAGARMEPRERELVFHPTGAARARVAFFTTCVMDVMFPHVNREAVRLLVLAGCEVRVPRDQGCCGALQAHAGLRRVAKRLARRNVQDFQGSDFVVTTSAGCGAALGEAGHWIDQEPPAAAARAFATRVRDIAEVLHEVGLPEPASLGERPLRAGYHDPCHLAHAQGVRAQPRALLARVPGLDLVDLPNADWCCGSAGVYNLTHPAMAASQLEKKLDAIAAVDPDVVVASNPGCLLHIARGARARGLRPPIVHLVELLGRAYPAPENA